MRLILPLEAIRWACPHPPHIVQRTLQLEEVPVCRASNGLVERQGCPDYGYVPSLPRQSLVLPDGCSMHVGLHPAVQQAIIWYAQDVVKIIFSFLRLSLLFTH